MLSDTEISNVKSSENEGGGRRSKTARKFTGFFSRKWLPDSFTVTLDWLSFMVECYTPPPDPGEAARTFGNVTLVLRKTGTPVFLNGWDILLHGEPVATLFTHGRNEIITKPGTAKLEVLNHVLYSDTWLNVVSEVCHSIGIEVIKNISRLDVAIDGANHVHEFLNMYVRQDKKREFPDLKSLGTWAEGQRVRMKGKANLDCKRFNRHTGDFDAFKVGSTRKCITVYNKIGEINARSHKEYIRETWERAGMDLTKDVWRCELRMNSEGVKDIENLEVGKLADPRYLLELFKTQIKNFFDFIVFENDSNVTRARHVDLFQLEALKVCLLSKVPRKVVEGAYKAKMAIHDAFKNVMQKRYLCADAIDNALNHITHTINLYNLQRFYEIRKPIWIEAYRHIEKEKFTYSV